MPKIIFTSRYIKSATPAQGANLVHYMAKRDGVEIPKIFDPSRPATVNQQKLIAEIVRAAPEIKESFEYEDYIAIPAVGNASELITSAFENNPTLWDSVRNYVDYVAKRPGAERSRSSGHGLWSGGDKPIVLSQVMDEVANHRGNLWTHVVSLRREDAERLGYDNATAWRELVKSKIPVIAEAMKIPLDDLRWYAAFHNTAYHPHIHLIVYSRNPSQGYLTEPGIERMRAAFATEIYKNELLHIYGQKDAVRAQVNRFANERMRELASQIQNGGADPLVAEMLVTLSAHLKNHKGKKQYGYLRPEVKRLVDDIVGRLAQDPRLAEMYGHWSELAAEVKSLYTGDIPEPLPLIQERAFKTIKNMVIRQALEVGEPPAALEMLMCIQGAGALLRDLARMLQAGYQGKQQNYEQAVDSKLLQKIRRKKQDLGQRMEV